MHVSWKNLLGKWQAFSLQSAFYIISSEALLLLLWASEEGFSRLQMAAHNNKRQIICNLGLRRKKCIHFACLESFHENKAFKVLKIRGNSNKVKSKYHRFKSHLWISKVRRVRIKIRKFILYLKKIFSNIPNCFLILENSFGLFSTVTNLWYKNSWKEIKRIFKS